MTNNVITTPKTIRHFRLYHDELGYWHVQYQPINVERWFTDMTFRDLGPAQKRLLLKIQRLPNHMIALVHDTLDCKVY